MSRTFQIIIRFALNFTILIGVALAASYVLSHLNLGEDIYRAALTLLGIAAFGISVEYANYSSRKAVFYPDEPSPYVETRNRMRIGEVLPAALGVAVSGLIISAAVYFLKIWFSGLPLPFVVWWKWVLLGCTYLVLAILFLTYPSFARRRPL